MKICFLCPDLGIPIDGHKGASSHIRGFVNALKRHGHEMSIITSRPVKEGTIDVPITVIPQPKIIEGILKNESPRTFRALRHVLYNCSIESLLENVIAKEKPDLIYERYSPFSVAGGIISKQNKIPHILEINAPLAEQGKRYRNQALQDASELLEISAFKQAGLLITLTKELKNWLIELGISEEKVKVRPCGVDEKLFHTNGESFRQEFEDKIVLGFLGSLKPWHDIELLASVFRKIARDPKYHLLVVGDGPMRKIINALSEELPGRVTCTGAIEQEDVPKYVRAMDIALAPYPEMDLFYFSPLKIYEYMAMGRAIIATGIGQINELIEDNKTGCLVPVGDEEAWIKTIKTLAKNSLSIKQLGQAAATEIRQNHTWEKRVQTFMNIVEEYLGKTSLEKNSQINENRYEKQKILQPC